MGNNVFRILINYSNQKFRTARTQISIPAMRFPFLIILLTHSVNCATKVRDLVNNNSQFTFNKVWTVICQFFAEAKCYSINKNRMRS
jgi:hypothetical protein